jgi:hypothetical protein
MKKLILTLMLLIMVGCGVSEGGVTGSNTNPQQLVEYTTMPGPEPTRYAPTVIDGKINIEIGIPLHISPLVVANNQIISFVNPPESAKNISWIIDYDPLYLAPIEGQNLSQYPVNGWEFKAIKPGKTRIELKNINSSFTSCKRNFCPEQYNYVLTYRLSIE